MKSKFKELIQFKCLKTFTDGIVSCIVYRYLYSASQGVSQTEALSVHFGSRKKVRLTCKARERRGKGSRYNVE